MRVLPAATFVLCLGIVQPFSVQRHVHDQKKVELRGQAGRSEQNVSFDEDDEKTVPSLGDVLQHPASAMNRRETLVTGATILGAPFLSSYAAGRTAASAVLTPEALATLETGDTIVRNIWLGRLAYPTLIVALEMGFFEALKNGSLSLQSLGEKITPKLQGNSRSLEGVSSVLASLGLMYVNKDIVSLTESARMVLLKDSPYYWGSQLLAADGMTASLRRRMLLESLNPNHQESKIHHEDHSDQMIDSFTESMQAHSAVTAEATAVALWSLLADRKCLLDMAGGSGCFAKAIASRVPHLQVLMVDLPRVVETWKRKNKGTNNIQAVAGDLFDGSTWPKNSDCVLLANVLHDWGEDQAQTILENAYHSLPAGGRVVVVEQLLASDRSGPLPASLASISMLLGDWRSGKQYSLMELKDMGEKVGFRRVELGPKCGFFHYAVLYTK